MSDDKNNPQKDNDRDYEQRNIEKSEMPDFHYTPPPPPPPKEQDKSSEQEDN